MERKMDRLEALRRDRHNKITAQRRIVKLVGVCLLVIFACIGAMQLFCAEAARLDGEWFYRMDHGSGSAVESSDRVWVDSAIANDDAWHQFNYPRQPYFERGTEKIWIMTTLPEREVDDAVLFMVVADQSFEVWVDTELVYRYGELERGGYSQGESWHMVTLPPGYAGRHLIIKSYSESYFHLGSFSIIELGTNVDEIRNLFKHDLPFVATIPLNVFMIILMMLYYISPAAPKKLYLCIIVVMLECLVLMTCSTNLKQLVVESPTAWWYLRRVAIYLLPFSANIVVMHIVDKKYRRLVWMTVMLYLVIFALAVLTELMGLGGLYGFTRVYYPLLPIVEAVVAYTVFSSAKHGNAYAQALLVPLVGMVFAGTYDGFADNLLLFESHQPLVPYSMLTLVYFILFIVRQQVKRERYLMARAAGLQDEVARAIERSEVDVLTQCFNRAKLETVLHDEISLNRTKPDAFSLIMLDIDFFKRINDKYGHDAGDEVLASFAATIRRHIKKTDVFVRYGGEEFILVCRGDRGDEARVAAERLRRQIEWSSLFDREHITCSVGVASWHGEGDTATKLLKRVDTALYTAKRTGRNRVCREPIDGIPGLSGGEPSDDTESK